MTTKPKPAPPTDWRQREQHLLDRRRRIAADIGALTADDPSPP